MSGNVLPFLQLEIKDKQRQIPATGHTGILLPQRTCRRVAGILKCLFPVLFLLLHQSGKRFARHIHLAAHNRAGHRTGQTRRQGTDGAQIGGYILAGVAVAAGRAAHQLPVLVFQRHR